MSIIPTDNLVDDTKPAEPPGIIEQVTTAIRNLILPTHKELISTLRVPTPIKVTEIIQIGPGGNIGSDFNDLSNIVYTCPLSAEAWLHRITITCPENGPGVPIIAPAVMQIMGTTFGEIIFQLPEISNTDILVPNQFIEGRQSAPHLDRGESLCVAGNGLPAGAHIRFDLQINLVQGFSEYTPKSMSPSDLTKAGNTNAIA